MPFCVSRPSALFVYCIDFYCGKYVHFVCWSNLFSFETCFSPFAVVQALEEALVTMLMGLHLIMIMMISQTPVLRIRASDKLSSER